MSGQISARKVRTSEQIFLGGPNGSIFFMPFHEYILLVSNGFMFFMQCYECSFPGATDPSSSCSVMATPLWCWGSIVLTPCYRNTFLTPKMRLPGDTGKRPWWYYSDATNSLYAGALDTVRRHGWLESIPTPDAMGERRWTSPVNISRATSVQCKVEVASRTSRLLSTFQSHAPSV